MREDLEALVQDCLDGTLDAEGRERLAREFEADPAARAEFVDQVQIHHRLRPTLEASGSAFTESVVREIRLLGDADRFSQGVVRQIKHAGTSSRRRVWEMAAAAMILAAVGFALIHRGGPGVAVRPAGQVLLVVGRVPLEAGDARVMGRLEGLGYGVVAKPALQVVPSDASGKAMIAISSTSLAMDVTDVPGELTAKFRDSAVPVLVWEPRLFYDLGMIAGHEHQKDWGALKDQSRLTVSDPSHAMAAGLSGTVPVYSSPNRISWGLVRGDAVKVAALEGHPDRAVLFAYDRGASMPGLVAPARRVGVFLFDTTAPHLTPQGWSLFDAAVRWCAAP
jgi:anti-sigma factor RsiW